MGTSVGVQGGIGFSMGTTHLDATCATIEAAKAEALLGNVAVAREVLCDVPQIRAARLRSGTPCHNDTAEAKGAIIRPDLTDPLVRKREGIPPLPQ
jgi:hypothetical protein